jgi:hypothetical protein
MKIKFLIIAILLSVTFSKCTTTRNQKKMAGYLISNYEVECMGTGMDGTQLLKVWGYGKNPDKAIIQAKKNAVHAIVFKGINTGKPGCMQRPLVNEPGSEIKNRNFFETFFTNGGRYLNFVSLTGDGAPDRIRISRNNYKVGIIVSVAHSNLRRDLEAAGIVNRLGQGF